MASIRREIQVAVPPAQAWDALRDVGRIHERLVRGFVTRCELEGDVRAITFANGMSVRERIIDVDDAERRVVWSALGDPFAHHNASVQAFESGDGGTRLVWIADLLPDALEEKVAGLIEQGLGAMKQTLEGVD
ncbi:SRPBCC family protein [Lysobacter arenosi]|jgi:carbon monoxide dehydrogenase subunit G|uniref:SRPBCC family protein n=1 Tax=Lysobacter arenosi TaxID=2795387 RepID=A0ABX7RA65_9GAMM|nr:SRPBCC family protein [Lysobacter arenosi]QSX74620.1 SRPBCC family protein [Lysobacter arenosi]